MKKSKRLLDIIVKFHLLEDIFNSKSGIYVKYIDNYNYNYIEI
jgi:hypothetical protein